MIRLAKKILPILIGQINFQLLKNQFYNRKKRLKDIHERKVFYSSFFKSGDIFFDVGANLGNRIDPILELGGKVIAIEPQSFCSSYLRRKYANSIVVIQKGLASKEGHMDIYISDSHTLSTFSQDWIQKVQKSRFKHHSWYRKEVVEMTTIDQLIKQYGVPSFIKIDVEGFELEVLKGLSQPIEMVSFEYTVPEGFNQLKACMDQIHKYSPDALFNYSVGETMQWGSKTWLSIHEMLKLVETQDFLVTEFGDIYASAKKQFKKSLITHTK